MPKIFITITFLAFLAFVSCKKNTSNPVQDNLMGNWKYFENIVDSNGNHIRDVHDGVYAVNSPNILVYYPDGTGAVLSSGTNIGTFTWRLISNNTYLQMISPGAAAFTRHIDSLTASRMVLKDTTDTPYSWQVYTKQ